MPYILFQVPKHEFYVLVPGYFNDNFSSVESVLKTADGVIQSETARVTYPIVRLWKNITDPVVSSSNNGESGVRMARAAVESGLETLG